MESTEADRRRGRADGLRSRGRSDCPCAPLAAFGVSISRMSARRDVQEAGRNARKKRAGRARGHVTAIGADETVVRVKGEKAGVVADAAASEVLGLDVLVKRDTREKQDKAQDGQGGKSEYRMPNGFGAVRTDRICPRRPKSVPKRPAVSGTHARPPRPCRASRGAVTFPERRRNH